MNWFDQHREALQTVFDDAKLRISRFPTPLHDLGLAYMKAFDVFQPGTPKNYICYTLPYWLQEKYPLTEQQCARLSLTNLFVMLYFFIQDDLMDAPPERWKEQLALSNLFHNEILQLLHEQFGADASLWNNYQRYMQEWAESVANETTGDYFQNNLVAIAFKAAPLKLAAAGALYYTGGNSASLTELEELIHEVLITLQMSDDWLDWEEDLVEGSSNCLLSFIRLRHELPEEHSLSPQFVRQAIHANRLASDYAAIAAERHEKITPLADTLPQLLEFHKSMTIDLTKAADAINRKVEALRSGGLNLLLSNYR